MSRIKVLTGLDAQNLGLGGGTGDGTNVLSLRGSSTLLDGHTSGHNLRVNKSATANDSVIVLETGGSARAQVGLIGNDDLAFRVSPNGTTFHDGIIIDKDTGAVTFPNTATFLHAPDEQDETSSTEFFYYGWTTVGTGWLIQRQTRSTGLSVSATTGHATLTEAWPSRATLGYS